MPLVEVLDETAGYVYISQLAAALESYLLELGLGESELTVVLLDDDAIAQHNASDRGVEGPTDVLSYPTFEPDGAWFPGVAHLGDILISLDTAARQAVENGHSLAAEVMVLAAHGLTHLRGFDHQTTAEWAPFTAAQERILELAGGGGEHA